MIHGNFINATELCLENDKKWAQFMHLATTKACLQELSLKLNVDKNSLYICKKGKGGSTFIHPELLPELQKWLKRQYRSDYAERSVKEEFVKNLPKNYKTEVACAAGFVDVITPKEVIEIKAIRSWKAAIGQAITYQLFFPEKSARIHLFGDKKSTDVAVIKDVCKSLGVRVTFH
jgi:hypothetical protein